MKDQNKGFRISSRFLSIFVLQIILTSATIIVNQIYDQQAQAAIVNISTNFMSDSTPINTFSTYENSTIYGIKFEYPSTGWAKSELLTDRVDVIEFTLLPHQQQVSPAFMTTILPRLTVSIETLPQNISTVQQYVDTADKILSSLGNFTLTGSRNTTLAGFPAIERIFIVQDPSVGENVKVSQVMTVKNNKAYVISYTASAANYSTYLPIAKELTTTFEITR